MKIITEALLSGELKQMAEATFGNLVKAVVDIERDLVAVDAELHSDLEAFVDYFSGVNQFMSSEDSWRNYFMPFTYALRRNH